MFHDIAGATTLRVEDAAFTLKKVGLLALRLLRKMLAKQDAGAGSMWSLRVQTT